MEEVDNFCMVLYCTIQYTIVESACHVVIKLRPTTGHNPGAIGAMNSRGQISIYIKSFN